MSLEYFAKYNDAPRKPAFATIDEPVVVFMGLTISDLVVAVVCFLLMAMFANSPFVGLAVGLLCAVIRKQYAKRFPPGTIPQKLWAAGLIRKRNVPVLLKLQEQTIYSP